MSAIERYEGPAHPAPAMDDAEWRHLERTAKVLANSGMVGSAFKGRPEAVMAVALTLHQLGLPVTLPTVNMFDFYEGQARPRVALGIAFANARGHHVWMPDDECDETKAVCYGRRAGDTQVHKVTFTLDQAKQANLLGKDNWKKYPADMLKWRAAGRLLKIVLGDTMLGLPSVLADADVPAVAPTDAASLPIIEHEGDDEAPEAPAGADTLSHEGRARAKAQAARNAIHAAKARIPAGQWKAAAAAAWRRAGLPAGGALDLADDQIETALLLVRQYLVLAALDAAGVGDSERRHVFIDAATNGEASSSKALTKAQFAAVMAAIEDGVGEPEPELAEQLEASLFAAGIDPADDGRPFE